MNILDACSDKTEKYPIIGFGFDVSTPHETEVTFGIRAGGQRISAVAACMLLWAASTSSGQLLTPACKLSHTIESVHGGTVLR